MSSVQAAAKHNFPVHRYKHGKQKHSIDLQQFKELLTQVEGLEQRGFFYLKKYDLLTIQSLLAAYYWLGVRKSELIGSKPKRYVLPSCHRHIEPREKHAEAIPGVLKENVKADSEWIYIEAAPRKKGSREAALMISLSFPYVNLIMSQWQRTEPKHRVWPVSEWDIWKIVKECDAKQYVHFFRFNRITQMCSDPDQSLADLCSWTGLSPQTVDNYLERSGRFIRRAAEKMKRQIEKGE
jgi:hypothetical protein